MSTNLPVQTNPVSEEREKLAWSRLRDDGYYDVVMYYPKTDKFKWYKARAAYAIVGDGEIINAEDMTGRLLEGVKLREWSVSSILYFWRQK